MGKDYLGKDQRATKDDKEEEKPIQGLYFTASYVSIELLCHVEVSYVLVINKLLSCSFSQH